MSSSTPNATKQDAAPSREGEEKKQVNGDVGTVTKTVQTVEVRSSAGQPEDEGVLKPVRVVHEIPAKEAKDAAVKQDK